MQTGGRLLGQGVFGCTFEPVPFCAGGSVFKKIGGLPAVGKVTSEDASAELAIGKAIMALPMASAYFALPSAGCRPALPIADPDIKDCRVMSESGEGTKFSMLIMPDAGQQLIKYGLNMQRLAANYKRIFVHLLEGAIIYQNAGYVHNDIHMGNILVDDGGVARYIDYGLAFNIQSVKVWEDANLGVRFKPKYIWQAPEIHAWRMMLNNVRLDEGVRQLKEINPEYAKMEHQYPTRKSLVGAIDDLFTKSPLFAGRDGGAMVRKYGKRFDCWRLGLCMWFLWDDLLHWSSLKETGLYAERELIRKVLGGMTDFDVDTRMTMVEALRLLDPNNKLSV
jgi:hypothetical protein